MLKRLAWQAWKHSPRRHDSNGVMVSAAGRERAHRLPCLLLSKRAWSAWLAAAPFLLGPG